MTFLDSTPIELLKLPARTYNALLKAGIGSVEQLTSYTVHRIFNLKGIGDKGVIAIYEALRQRNLTLKQ